MTKLICYSRTSATLKSVSCEVAVFIRSLRPAEKTARTDLKRKVTLKTIADHLGLTPGTVSAALK